MNRSSLSVLFVTVCIGCSSSPLAQVEGVVRLNGQPLEGAEIEFQPEKGTPSYAVSDADGRYKLRHLHQQAGAVPGKYTVRVQMTQSDESSPQATLPPQYNEQSTLTRDLVAGNNTIYLDLATPPQTVVGQPATSNRVR